VTYRPTEMAEAQAIGLCYVARFKGLPPIHSIRQAVVQLHPEECGWCVYPPAELLAMLTVWHAVTSSFVEERWQGLPRSVRLASIKQAQVTE
jgi:xanthine dehydrogenase iron-sulfur cluster and FAD-binding subunit A